MPDTYTPRDFRRLWPEFAAESWQGWASIEDVAFGDTPADPQLVHRLTGRQVLPSAPVSELVVIAGRGAGKSRWAARLAVHAACGRTYRRAPGERIYVGIFAPDKRQAGVTLSYVTGLLHAVPALESLIVRELGESVELSTGCTVEVIRADKAAPRGRSYALAIVEEAAFLPQADSTDPDTELLRALRPALARVPGSMLVVISSPYARRGELYRAWRDHYGKNESATVLVVKAPTLDLNPSFDAREIERVYAEDPVSAAAEYGAEFRSDVEAFVTREAVEGCVIAGRIELPPVRGIAYQAFADPSGGSGDSFTLAIGHGETVNGQPIAMVDCIRERMPPFSPETVVSEYAELLKSYGVRVVKGDRYAGEWPRETFLRYGITYKPSDKVKSDIYRDALALLNGNRIALLDIEKLITQLVGLERRTSRGGRDSIDHAPGGHDDIANVVCGLAVNLAVKPRYRWIGDRDQRPKPPPRLIDALKPESGVLEVRPSPPDPARLEPWAVSWIDGKPIKSIKLIRAHLERGLGG